MIFVNFYMYLGFGNPQLKILTYLDFVQKIIHTVHIGQSQQEDKASKDLGTAALKKHIS